MSSDVGSGATAELREVGKVSIDSQVAERVMDWEQRSDGMWVDIEGELHPGAFSEDIGACFAEVVPEMRAQGWELVLMCLEGQSWQATFRARYDKYGPLLGVAAEANPAEAICLAALRAVGVTEEELS